MTQYVFTFIATCFPVFTLAQTLIAFSQDNSSLVTNTIITILAGAVAILWKKIEANYKKLEADNNQLKVSVALANTKIDECEKDRSNLRKEIEELKQQGCSIASVCLKKDGSCNS